MQKETLITISQVDRTVVTEGPAPNITKDTMSPPTEVGQTVRTDSRQIRRSDAGGPGMARKMTVEATAPEPEQGGSAAIQTGWQTNRRASFEAVGLLVGILIVLLVVSLVIGVTPPGG